MCAAPPARLRQYSGAETEILLPEIANVFRAAFAGPPYFNTESHVEKFRADWPNRSRRAGFLFIGSHEISDASPLTGFIYGWLSRKGDHWNSEFTKTLGDEAAFWLEDCFELVDLAVAPQAQGQGLGRRLLDELFTFVSARTALLLTHREDTPASRLYLTAGWEELRPYDGAGARYRILGRDNRCSPGAPKTKSYRNG